MKRSLLFLLIVFSILIPFSRVSAATDVDLLSGKTMNIGTSPTNISSTTTALTDRASPMYYFNTGQYAWYSFPQSVKITSLQYVHSGGGPLYPNGTWYLYDANGVVIYQNPSSSNPVIVPDTVGNVSKVALYARASGWVNEIYVNGVPPDTTPPSVPTGLTASPLIKSINFSWDSVVASDLAGYNIYKNSSKVNSLPITGNSYLIEDLVPDENYAFQITSIDFSGNESAKSMVVNASAMSEIVYPTLNYLNLKDTSLRLSWDSVGSSYEVYQDGVLQKSTTYTFFDITQLNVDSDYSFYVISVDKYGRRNQSNTILVHTNPPELKSTVLTTSNVTHNSFRLNWTLVDYADDYTVFLNGSEITTTSSLYYDFTSLNPETFYSFKVRANSVYSISESTGSVKTNVAPIPRIENAQISPGSSATTRTLSYTPSPEVTSVKVYVDGQLVGEYPASQREIELDYSMLTGMLAEVKIEPTDPDGEPYQMSTPAKSTGNEEVDNMLLNFLKAFGISHNAFVYLALASIPLFIIVVLFIWMRFQYKGMFGKVKNYKGEAKDTLAAAQRQSDVDKYDPEAKQKNKNPNFVPYHKMTDEQKMEYRSKKHEEQTGFKIIKETKRNVPVGFLGMGGQKMITNRTFEKDGVQFVQKYVRGQGRVYVPKDLKNQVMLAKVNVNKFTSSFNIKKPNSKG